MRKLKKSIFGIVLSCMLLMGILYTFQEKLIFLPEVIHADYKYDFSFDYDEVNLKTEDNQTINTLHIKAKNPKGIVLFFHGNKGNLIRWGEITSYFTQFNYDVFVIDYRGYGKSTGDFNEELMYKDALMSYDYVKTKFHESQIVVYGRSLGTTFASKVGAENNPKHIILEAPFFSLYNAANYRYKIIPKFLLNFKFNTYQLVQNITAPTTLFHGTDDNVTPYKGSKKLFKLLKSTSKELILLEAGTHHNLRDFREYTKALASILN
ncbi:MAG: alpha/beta hydrolase [Flavobacteriaceae bacterium]|nr:alpha/beta hydrolase [Flavobacteriaceae bacterium]